MKCQLSSSSISYLARHARNVMSDVIWIEDSPSSDVEALHLDSISIQ